MWPRFSGCSEQSIRRMRDIEWFTQSFMTCNKHTKDRFFRDADMDWFYTIGEDKPMSMVHEYDQSQRQRFITIMDTIRDTVEQQQTVPASKRIPQRTFWAMLIVAEYFYDSNNKYTIHSFDQFYRDVHTLDANLVNDSKVEQTNDMKATKSKNPHLTADELSDLHPDKHYYFNWSRRMEVPDLRNKRKESLIDTVKDAINKGQFLSIVAPPVAMASK